MSGPTTNTKGDAVVRFMVGVLCGYTAAWVATLLTEVARGCCPHDA